MQKDLFAIASRTTDIYVDTVTCVMFDGKGRIEINSVSFHPLSPQRWDMKIILSQGEVDVSSETEGIFVRNKKGSTVAYNFLGLPGWKGDHISFAEKMVIEAAMSLPQK